MTTNLTKSRIYEGKTTRADSRGLRPTRFFKLENRCSIQLSYHRILAQARVASAGCVDKGKTTLDSSDSDSTFRTLSHFTGW